MSDPLIEEARRRGRNEAERRDLQYKIDDAYHAEVEKVEGARRRKAEQEEAARREKAQAAHTRRVLTSYAAQFGWIALCVFIAADQTWQTIPALDDFFWRKEWLAYVGLFILFVFGRRVILSMFNEQRA